MIRPSSPSPTRRGYTLIEVMLALGLSSLLMMLVYGAMQSFWQLSTTGRLDAERCQLARTLIRRMEMDIRSLTYKPAEAQDTSSTNQAAASGAGNTASGSSTTSSSSGSSGSTGSAGSSGSSGSSSTSGSSGSTSSSSSSTTQTTVEPVELLADVHLNGTSQSLEMIALRPSRNRTGSAEDAAFLATQSDRRRVGYMFSASMSGASGLYYRNIDQQYERAMELEGNMLNPITEYQLLAAEVADLRFQYLDGSTGAWLDQWNSRDLAGLPRAIKITLQFHPESQASTNRLRTSKTSTSTDVFQTVVHLPLSDVPLDL